MSPPHREGAPPPSDPATATAGPPGTPGPTGTPGPAGGPDPTEAAAAGRPPSPDAALSAGAPSTDAAPSPGAPSADAAPSAGAPSTDAAPSAGAPFTDAATAAGPGSAWRRLPGRRSVVGAGLLLGVLLFFLTQTRLPAVFEKLPTLGVGASGRFQSTFGQLVDPAALPESWRWVAYGLNLWDANAIGMLFAILLGAAAVAAFPPQARLGLLAGRRGMAAAGLGGGLGMPLFMCSACSAPVSLGFYRSGAGVETTLGIILGSALLNPVGLLAVFTLLPLPLGVARVLFGLAAILVVVPLVALVHERPAAACGTPFGSEAVASALSGAPVRPVDDRWGRALADVLSAWWRNAVDFAVRLVPAMFVAGFAVGAALQLLPPQRISDLTSSTVLAVVVVAAVGTLLQLPTLFEIPLVVGVLALGLDPGAAAALLVTAPSAGLVTFGIVRRDLGWRTPTLLLAGTFVGGVAVGLAVSALNVA